MPRSAPTAAPSVIVINHSQPLAGLAEGKDLRKAIEQGATAIAFAPSNKELAKLFPAVFFDDAAEAEKEKKAAAARTATRPVKHAATKKSPAKPAATQAEEKRP